MKFLKSAVLALSLGCLATTPGHAQALKRLDVNVFNAGFVWPMWVAQDKGFFAANGLEINLIPTPGSIAQMTGLIDGKFDIAMTAIDNVIAYMEGQGEGQTQTKPDLVAVMGSDNGFLSLVTAPEIKTFADLRSKTLSVDALTTGYAFALMKMLEVEGLKQGDYTLAKVGGMRERYDALLAGSQVGTLSVPPYDLIAKSKGYNVLGKAISVLKHYQGVVAAVRRNWLPEHRQDLIGFIRADIAAVQWLYDPANKAEALAIYQKHLPGSTQEIASLSYDVFLDPETGFDKKAAIDLEGVRQVMAIRSEYGKPQKRLTDPGRYYDLSFYDEATKPN